MAGRTQDDVQGAAASRAAGASTRQPAPRLDLLLVGLVAMALRLPALLAGSHLTFDDGVYGASAVAMRRGGVPFRDVFSSQGPLHLPLLRAADLLGMQGAQAPRLLPLLSGVAATLLAVLLGRRLGGRRGGLVAGLLVACSGSFVWVSSAIHSDSPAIALSAGAVLTALHHREHPTLRTAVLAGALLGAGVAVKSVVLPAAVPVALLLLPARRPGHWAAGAGASAAVVVGAALPFGLADVVDQAVTYHAEATSGRDPLRNAGKVVSTLADRDPLLLVLLAATLLVAVGAARARGRRQPAERALAWARLDTDLWLVGWLAATAALLLYIHPLWRPHLSHLVLPLALLVARRPPDPRLVVVATVLVLPVQLAHVATVTWPDGYEGETARIVDELRSLPDEALAISDEPGLVWRAGLATPPDLVDTSVLRVESGRLTRASLVAAAADPEVCAVVVTSSRFGRFEGLAEELAAEGYAPTSTGSLPVLYRRASPSCGGG